MAKKRTVDPFSIPSNPIKVDWPNNHPWQVASRRPGYPFDFSFMERFGEVGRSAVLEFERFKGGKKPKSWDAYYLMVRHVFTNVPDAADKSATSFDWRTPVHLWALSIRGRQDIKGSTKKRYIHDANLFLEHLQLAGVLPDFDLPAPPQGRDDGQKGTFGTVPPKTDPKTGTPQTILGAGNEAVELWASLTILHDLSKWEDMRDRMALLLGAVRGFAERKIREHWNNFRETAAAIASSEFDCEAFEAEYIRDGKYKSGWREPLRHLPALWKYLEWKFGGVFFDDALPPQILNFLTKELQLSEIRKRFHSTTETVLPFMIIILIETLMNVEACRILKQECLRPSVHKEERKIAWVKGRADDAVFLSAVPVGEASALERGSNQEISSVQAVECLREMAKRLVDFADHHEKDCLLLCWRAIVPQGMSHVANISEQRVSKRWREVKAEDAVLDEFHLKLDQIRETVALLEFIKSGGNVFYIKILLRHKGYNTVIRYLRDRAAYLFDFGAARQVNEMMVVAAARDRKHLWEMLELTEEKVRSLLAVVRDAEFFGFVRTENPPVNAEVVLSAIEEFLLGVRIFLEGSATMAAGLLAVSSHLRANAEDLRWTPEWQGTWLPTLIIADFLLSRLPVDVKVQGRELVEEFEISFGDFL